MVVRKFTRNVGEHFVKEDYEYFENSVTILNVLLFPFLFNYML